MKEFNINAVSFSEVEREDNILKDSDSVGLFKSQDVLSDDKSEASEGIYFGWMDQGLHYESLQ